MIMELLKREQSVCVQPVSGPMTLFMKSSLTSEKQPELKQSNLTPEYMSVLMGWIETTDCSTTVFF